jgi:transposase
LRSNCLSINLLFIQELKSKISFLKKSYTYREADPHAQQIFQQKIQQLDKDIIYYLDEAGIEERAIKGYGWAKKGTRIIAKITGNRKKAKRISIISVMNKNRLIAPLFYEGTLDKAMFEQYMIDFLLQRIPPGSIIVLDNASIHNSLLIQSKFKEKDCSLLYLPKYSPELNPIEHAWSWIKDKMKRLYDPLKENFLEVLSKVVIGYSSNSFVHS